MNVLLRLVPESLKHEESTVRIDGNMTTFKDPMIMIGFIYS